MMAVERSLDQLAGEIKTVAAQINAASCRWLALIAEFDRRLGWHEWGMKSCAHWVAWQCALGPGTAREYVRVARRLGELPLVNAAFERGELSYAKVRALTRVETVEREAELLRLAVNMTASQLERTVRAYRGVVAVRRGHESARNRREVTYFHDDDGSLVLRCRLPAEEGALMMAALDSALDELGAERVRAQRADAERPADSAAGCDRPTGVEAGEWSSPRSAAEREPPDRADALLLLCDRALGGGRERTGAERYQVQIEVDVETLTASTDAGVGVLADSGTPLPPETVRRLCCDSGLVATHKGRSGTRTRTIPSAIRRALRRRDRCCRFPGCSSRRLDAHHIKHWAHGGPTSTSNLVLLCRRHHTLVHEGGYTLDQRRNATDELRFYRPDGRRIPQIPRPDRAVCPTEIRAHAASAGPETLAGGLGERLDLTLGVDALIMTAPIT